jgi:hypothetical protein
MKVGDWSMGAMVEIAIVVKQIDWAGSNSAAKRAKSFRERKQLLPTAEKHPNPPINQCSASVSHWRDL